jgi:cytochrome c biogenesis protein
MAGAVSSAKLTLILVILLFVAIVLYQKLPENIRLLVLLTPIILLMINFIAVLVLRKAFASSPSLLVFHLALFFLVILVGLGQLTYLKGTLELSTLGVFSGQLENTQAGPWHDYQLSEVSFTNLGFSIHYHKGIKRDNTLNRIRLGKDSGNERIIEIGDHIPLVIGHYRFYTTHNKGYAPLFHWLPADGGPVQLGSVHLPAYPIHEYKQAREWTLPKTQQKIWTMLVMEEDVLPEHRNFNFRIPDKHYLVIRIGDQRHILRVGDEIKLDSGILRYHSLTSWMGYKVDYDWTRSWLFITCLIALLSLSLHYVSRLRRDSLAGNAI